MWDGPQSFCVAFSPTKHDLRRQTALCNKATERIADLSIQAAKSHTPGTERTGVDARTTNGAHNLGGRIGVRKNGRRRSAISPGLATASQPVPPTASRIFQFDRWTQRW